MICQKTPNTLIVIVVRGYICCQGFCQKCCQSYSLLSYGFRASVAELREGCPATPCRGQCNAQGKKPL